MSEELKNQKAAAVYQTLCNTLDAENWKYKKEENYTISCGARGDDLPINVIIKVDADRQVVRVMSVLPFKIKEDKRVEAAVGICAINDRLVNGVFDYDINSGAIIFKMTNSYRGTELAPAVFAYLLYCTCQTVDEYNDMLLTLSSGILSLEEFVKKVAE